MVVEDLTAEEQQIAAGTSYAYWATQQLRTTSTTRLLPCDETISSAQQIRMATREARRHYVGENGNYERALLRLKRSLQWRKERRVDLLRFCFWTSQPVASIPSARSSCARCSKRWPTLGPVFCSPFTSRRPRFSPPLIA